MKKLHAVLLLIAMLALLLTSPGMVDCPPGYVDCHGVCVPYPCPD